MRVRVRERGWSFHTFLKSFWNNICESSFVYWLAFIIVFLKYLSKNINNNSSSSHTYFRFEIYVASKWDISKISISLLSYLSKTGETKRNEKSHCFVFVAVLNIHINTYTKLKEIQICYGNFFFKRIRKQR